MAAVCQERDYMQEKMFIDEKYVGEVGSRITDFMEEIVKIADKHGVDRDELLARVGIVVQNMIEMVTFKDYRVRTEENPQTRMEHIKSMSVEELADKMIETGMDTMIDFCQNFCGECENIPDSECRKCLIKYLNAPVEQKKAIPTEHFTERFNKVV